MKITILGPSGSGKTTLAKKISDRFGIPRLELDRLWFECGGYNCFINGCSEEEKSKVFEQIKNKVENFLSENENWVIDGVYTKVQTIIADTADDVVLIKRPVLKRATSHIVRVAKNDGRHPETTKFQDFLFSKTIIKRWLKGENKKLQEFLDNYNDKLVVLRSFREVDDYFSSIS